MSVDYHRLLPHLRPHDPTTAPSQKQLAARSAPGDHKRLRAIPILGATSSTQPGTHPERDAFGGTLRDEAA